MNDWSDDERALSVFVSTVECGQAERVVRLGADMIQCQMTLGVPVGHRNVSVVVGGQAGGVPERDPRGIFIVCSQGLYGMTGDSCAPCPRGATCKGFIPDQQAVIDAGVNVSAGPVRVGRLEYDIGGIHTYPIPDAGFFNLNGSMAPACPPGMRVPGRDICIVPCMPATSCLEDNVCAEAYASTAPMYRCASCAKGFYRRNGDCERCPQDSAAQFIILLFLAMVAAALAYWMNRFNINPAFISIGLDYFQVIAIFAQSKVPWPQVIKDLFYILSAFNLNLEILAPECFLPEVTFSNKFAAIISMPIVVYLLFGAVHGWLIGWKRYLKKQEWRKVNSHLPGLISASLLLLYIFYLYVTKTILDVFNCVPTEPPDGRLYLAAVFEECFLPGGAHLTLLPYAVLAVIVYTIGYPAFLAQLLWRRSEMVMEDQYLRAKGCGDSRLENPHAYEFRKTFSRVYYQFKPEYYFWILAIIVRKFCIAFTSLMFGRNVGFQMAACLMILFLAYAAQVRYSPYMSPDEHDSVIRRLLQLSASSKLHNRLRATLAQVEASGRKRGRTNKLLATSKFTAVSALYMLAGILFNYNFVDATLLFSACIVNLCGLLYQTARPADTFYAASRDGVTGVVLTVIALSVLYWFIVVIVDVSQQFKTRVEDAARGRARERLQRKKAKTKKRMVDEGSKLAARLPNDVFTRGLGGNNTVETTVSNPMFLKKDTGTAVVNADQAHRAIMEMDTPPDQMIWDLFKSTYAEQFAQIRALGEQLSSSKADNAKLQETIENAGLSGLLYDSSRLVLDPYRGAGSARPTAARRQFGQVAVGGAVPRKAGDDSGGGGGDDKDEEAELDAIMGRRRSGSSSSSDADGGDKAGGDGDAAPRRKRFSVRGFSMSGDDGGSGAEGGSAAPAVSKRASVRLGALFGLGGSPLSSEGAGDATAAADAKPAAAGGGWRTSLRLTGFNLKNVSAMLDADQAAGGAPAGTGPALAATVAPARPSALSAIFGGGSVLKSSSAGPAAAAGGDDAIAVGNPLARGGMVSPLAAARAAAASGGGAAASAGGADGGEGSGPTGRGSRKRLAGKVVAKGPAATGVAGSPPPPPPPPGDGAFAAASPMARGGGGGGRGSGGGKAEAALRGFKEKYAAVLSED
jgi:hypothetical protein